MLNIITICCCSVAKSCLTLCNPMDCTPGVPVFHYLPEFLKFMSTESVMLSNHLTLYCPLLLLPSISPSIRVFSNEYSGLIFFRIDWFDLQTLKSEILCGILGISNRLRMEEAGTPYLNLRSEFGNHL